MVEAAAAAVKIGPLAVVAGGQLTFALHFSAPAAGGHLAVVAALAAAALGTLAVLAVLRALVVLAVLAVLAVRQLSAEAAFTARQHFVLFAAAREGKGPREIIRGRHAVNAEGKDCRRGDPQHNGRALRGGAEAENFFCHAEHPVPGKADVQTHEQKCEVGRRRVEAAGVYLRRDELCEDDLRDEDAADGHHREIDEQQQRHDIFELCSDRHRAEFFRDARDPFAVENDVRDEAAREAEPGDLVKGHAAEGRFVEKDHENERHEDVQDQHPRAFFLSHMLIPPFFQFNEPATELRLWRNHKP